MDAPTVIETARKMAGVTQGQLSAWARTAQSSISEYESRRKSPTLAVVERLLEAADAELAVKPIVYFDYVDDPEIGTYVVPDRLWSVPLPDCFARVQVLRFLFKMDEDRIWDLSVEEERLEYYERAILSGLGAVLTDSVDGLLLIQAWPRLNLPDVIRQAWQPLIDAATVSQDRPPRDPGRLGARIASEIGIEWPPRKRRRLRMKLTD